MYFFLLLFHNNHEFKMNDNQADITSNTTEEELELRNLIKQRIGKRLAYILRYGAPKEGLKLYDGGFIKLNELLNASIIKRNRSNLKNTDINEKPFRRFDDTELIMEELKTSSSHRHINRFELKEINNETYVRATYGRKFTRSPFHTDSKVTRLLEITLNYIIQNINNYDFEGFPDEFLIK